MGYFMINVNRNNGEMQKKFLSLVQILKIGKSEKYIHTYEIYLSFLLWPESISYKIKFTLCDLLLQRQTLFNDKILSLSNIRFFLSNLYRNEYVINNFQTSDF